MGRSSGGCNEGIQRRNGEMEGGRNWRERMLVYEDGREKKTMGKVRR